MHRNKIILNGKPAEDGWQVIAGDIGCEPTGSYLVLPVTLWIQQYNSYKDRKDIGVWFDSTEFPDSEWAGCLQALPLIAVNFPVFSDGRGFSLARLLRERFKFQGELRAIGYVLRDQLCFMKRCGFNSFQLPEDTDLAEAVSSLDDFSEYYQGAVDQPIPLFRRNR